MGKFLLRRMVNYMVLITIAASAGYFLASATLNPRENFAGRNPPVEKSSIDAALNDINQNNETPVFTRFKKWAGGVITADFGKQVDGDPIWPEMKRRMGVSFRLLIIGAVLGTVLGLLAGVLGAVKQYKATDNILTVWSFVMLSTPVFLTAILLKVAAVKVNRAFDVDLFLYTGEYSVGDDLSGWSAFVDRLKHLILPTLALTLGGIASYSRYQRATMLDVIGSDFLRTARAKGLRKRRALLKHGLRTAMIPMTTFFAFSFTLLITGSYFIEILFGWHGMGEWFVLAINRRDINVAAAGVVFSGILVLIAGMLADVAHAALDPRVRVR